MACAKSHDRPPSVIDPELQPYVSRFFDEAAARGVTQFPLQLGSVTFFNRQTEAKITVSDEPSEQADWHQVGKCTYAYNDISIDREFFKVANEVMREELIFHELGHCVLAQQHISGQAKAVIPITDSTVLGGLADRSIMTPVQSGVAYSAYRAQYLDALFENRTVDFGQALQKAYPGIAKLLKSKVVDLEIVVNRIAVEANYSAHISVALCDYGSSISENVFSINHEDIMDTEHAARAFFSNFTKDVLDKDSAQNFETKMRNRCEEESKDVLCRVLPPDRPERDDTDESDPEA